MKGAKTHLALFGSILLAAVISYLSDRLDPYFLRVIVTVGINIILAVSLNLVNGYTGQFSLGHAGFMCIGAYTSAVITMFVAPKIFGQVLLPTQIQSWPLFLCAALAGGLMASISGLIVGIPSLRLKGDYLAIVTLGFGEIIRIIFLNIPAVGAARGLPAIPSYTTFFWAYSFAFVTIYVVLSIVHSSYGRGFIAVHDDEIAAEAMGINTTRYKIIAFTISAFFAGIAGALYAHYKTFISPNGFDFMRSIEIVVMVILGGMGNTIGVIAAAILLTVLPEVLRPVQDYRMVLYSFLLIVLMLTRPQGLFRIKWRPRIKPASEPVA
jgi:branched-chain amino acid transport system permease protein